MAVVKCQVCKLKEDKALMVQESDKKYYHTENCHSAYLTEKAFKKKEAESKMKLSLKIAEVYGLDSYKLIPSTFYPYIEDLRNDSTLFGKMGKQYKAGIPYEGISYAYEYCKHAIRSADVNPNLNFKNTMMRLRYGLAIVKNNLADAKHDFELKMKLKKNLDQSSSIEKVTYIEEDEETENTYKSKIVEDDISDLLD